MSFLHKLAGIKPSHTAHTRSDVSSTVSFNRPGEWGTSGPDRGPALALPATYAGLKLVGNLFVEFLHVGTGSGKNHVVFRAMLEAPIVIGGKNYYAARISMDPADVEFLVLDDSEDGAFYDADKEPGMHYFPGQLNVKFLGSTTPSTSQQFTMAFPIRKANLTLGELIAVAKDKNIYKFVFLAYPGVAHADVWKGCRDFILQFYLLLIERSFIAELTTDGQRLTDRIPFVYSQGQPLRPQPVDKGDFVRFHRNEKDAHVRAAYGE
ncbi:hypothetical protein DXG03_005875 [Asterophora parasitica]|uniref:Uncharacterized protein n=1 Tax=Asterophora parasitica TaxID=117018 RepID=A0A9P7K9I4_9AGAR|nr:hypothetical protein DXG03_005875 [Asterophora parasitica]